MRDSLLLVKISYQFRKSRRLTFENLEGRRLFAADVVTVTAGDQAAAEVSEPDPNNPSSPSPFQNPNDRFDVNDDGRFSPADLKQLLALVRHDQAVRRRRFAKQLPPAFACLGPKIAEFD